MRTVFSFCFTEQHKLSLLRPSEDERKMENGEKLRRTDEENRIKENEKAYWVKENDDEAAEVFHFMATSLLTISFLHLSQNAFLPTP